MFFFESQEQQEASVEFRGPVAGNLGPRGLPRIELPVKPVLCQAPAAPQPDAKLPEADILVILSTSVEWDPFHYVFTNSISPLPQDAQKNHVWRELWYRYERNYWKFAPLRRLPNPAKAASADPCWGFYYQFDLGGKRVLVLKKAPHMYRLNGDIPLEILMEQALEECRASLVLSTGSAAATRPDDLLGDVLLARSARFLLKADFVDADFNNQLYQSSWTPPTSAVAQAQAMFAEVMEMTAHDPRGLEASLNPSFVRKARIRIETQAPILTTDETTFGTTGNGLGSLGCAAEMDDALVAMVCSRHKIEFGFIRNLSSPVLSGDLPSPLQHAWAVTTHQRKGLLTNFNGALATWAVLTGQ